MVGSASPFGIANVRNDRATTNRGRDYFVSVRLVEHRDEAAATLLGAVRIRRNYYGRRTCGARLKFWRTPWSPDGAPTSLSLRNGRLNGHWNAFWIQRCLTHAV
jgi:hypothetical protein